MPKFDVKTSFTFTGSFEIIADSEVEAQDLVEKHCGMTVDSGIHTTLPDEECPDWMFVVHPDKRITAVERIG